ncbi:enoyl-CoA hydratase/isomerase family protein [Ramlibacter sp. H39-3-26]|uniref:enoyl-CoA hydratase/isomerase family protein n=1 Tax=Curvibacter soli TaxID=3031331 RepID=UPI0023DA6D37|nr:enoyl-CoA hydratase/isomerase family protein [Ramlibacter sp. H39-3-26]MDF1485351.1 enoyl-CoA hydratase/isomerase family protein [Ramlibacter sp. H39-3-26]
MSGAVLYDCGGAGPAPGVVEVVLAHPGRLNAMTRAMWRQLRSVFESIQCSADARCVLVSGQGGAFCAGGDISEYPGFRFDEAALRGFHEDDVWGGLQAMLDCDVPIVACIEGACMGAGVEIASCCDVRLAAADARFGAPIAKLGFAMAPRELALVARAAGELTTRELLLQAAVLDASTLRARGFLNHVLPQADARGEALAAARRIAALAPQAARRTKQTLRALAQVQGGQAPAWSALLATAYGYAGDAEHREGIAAFLEKRPARF